MIFAVIPFESSPVLQEKIRELEVPTYDAEAPGVYFVSFKGTTRKLAEALGYNEDDEETGVVIPVSNYFGFASQNLWEWLEAYRNGD